MAIEPKIRYKRGEFFKVACVWNRRSGDCDRADVVFWWRSCVVVHVFVLLVYRLWLFYVIPFLSPSFVLFRGALLS